MPTVNANVPSVLSTSSELIIPYIPGWGAATSPPPQSTSPPASSAPSGTAFRPLGTRVVLFQALKTASRSQERVWIYLVCEIGLLPYLAEEILQRRRKPRWRGLSGLSWPPSFPFRVSVRVRLSAPCQTRHWMMMTTMITIACSPAHREAAMRGGSGTGGRRRPRPPPRKKPRPLPLRAAGARAARRRRRRCPRRSDFSTAAAMAAAIFSSLPSSEQSLEPFPGRSSSTVYSSRLLTIYT